MLGPWNSGDEWERMDVMEAATAIDGDDGTATVKLSGREKKDVAAAAKRTKSNPDINPTTGTDLGAGPGAGNTKAIPQDQ